MKDLRVKANSIFTIAGTLSGGNQQKVVLAKWLLTNPRVLFLDEPTRGIDVGAKAEILRSLEAMAADGVALVVVSSELEETVRTCSRAYVFRDRVQVGLAGKRARPVVAEDDAGARCRRASRNERPQINAVRDNRDSCGRSDRA